MRVKTFILEDGRINLTGHAGVDVATAVRHDHFCEDAGCDIHIANDEADCPFSAAHMLMGATECEATTRMMALYGPAVVGTHLYDCPDWETWKAHHDRWGRECRACGSFTYADDSWEPDNCANCSAVLIDGDTVFDAYVDCALWASTDDNGEPLDIHQPDDIDPDSLASMRDDVDGFIGDPDTRGDLCGLDPSQIGHDFWLTRNRHGAGFWDRGLGERGDRLTQAAHVYGESDLYVGDDGVIYVTPL